MTKRRLFRLSGYASAAAAAVAGLLSCAPEPYAPPPEKAVPSNAVLQFEIRSAERTLLDCIAGAPSCTYVRFDHPNVVDPPPELAAGAQVITDAVQTFLSRPLRPDEAPGTPRELFERFLAEASSYEGPGPLYLERKAFVVRATPRIVSLGFAERGFLGGAPPLETYHFENFDVTTGERLSLSDVVPATKQEELRLLAERAFRKERGLEPEASLAEAGFEFDEERFILTENFAIEDEGLSFYYNPYAIAPYSHGPTEVRLAFEELEALLTPLVKDGR